MFISKSIFSDYSFFLFLQSIIVIGLKVLVTLRMKNFQRIIFCSVYLFAYFYNIFNVRQDISISLVLLAIVFFGQRIIIYSIFILIASLFHKSALIAFPLIFINLINNKTLPILLIFMVASIVTLIKFDISSMLPDSISYKYYDFIYAAPEAYSKDFIGQIMSLITKLPYIILFYYCLNKFILSKHERYVIIIALLGFTISLISILSGIGMLNRIAIYLYITELYVFPLIMLKYISTMPKNNTIIISAIFIVLYIGRFYSYINSYADLYFPYESILEINFKNVY